MLTFIENVNNNLEKRPSLLLAVIIYQSFHGRDRRLFRINDLFDLLSRDRRRDTLITAPLIADLLVSEYEFSGDR